MITAKPVALAAVYAAAVGIAVVAAESYLRRTGAEQACLFAPPPAHERRPPAVWAKLDPELGWVGSGVMDGVNPQGFRDPRDFWSFGVADDARRVMVLGDSFIWGFGVESEHTVPRHLERTLGDGWVAFNLGVPGWGVDQMYLAYLRYRDVLRPHAVVLAYIDDDVSRMLTAFRVPEGFDKPILRIGPGGALVRDHGPPNWGPLRRGVERSVVLRCSVRELRRMFAARPLASRVFTALAEETAARGEDLVVVRIADRAATTSRWSRWWWARGFEHVLPGNVHLESLPHFSAATAAGRQLYLPDGHLNETGTARLAELVASRLNAGAPSPDRNRYDTRARHGGTPDRRRAVPDALQPASVACAYDAP